MHRRLLFVAVMLLAAAPWALGDVVRVDVTISYFPERLGVGPPIFQNSLLTGSIQFYNETGVNPPVFTPGPPPINVGNIAVGGQFSTFFIPTDPCVGGGTCQLDFSFSGFAGQFAAFGFSNTVDLPQTAPGPPPIVPVGIFLPSGPPIHQMGQIVAFDAPVVVGTWEVTISAVPEPKGVALVLALLLCLMAGSRRWRGARSESA